MPLDTLSELQEQIRSSPSPFPPLLCAYGLNCLVAQTYVSSHPLSGLLLVDPPMTIAQAMEQREDLRRRLKDETEEFNYEPYFPVAILTSRRRAEELEQHRLRTEFSEDVHLLVSSGDDPISDDGFA